jgi:hypothetical protein
LFLDFLCGWGSVHLFYCISGHHLYPLDWTSGEGLNHTFHLCILRAEKGAIPK